ncbi:MAG: alpha,alpha-trehalase [Phormidium sp. SL48-SHIP]|nr:MAG: alpha,alpha-trehalase [Phormidium sp. SL48-SHIP]
MPLLPNSPRLQPVIDYIRDTWTTLTRTQAHILEAAKDSKIERPPGSPWIVYISPQEDRDLVQAELKEILPPSELTQIELRVLPPEMDQIDEHGLLYLPKSYVVPGGRFNELYGWDSYFIALGLLRDGELELAQNAVDLLVYEIEHYGTVLNANRSYMLERSHPPLLARGALEVFEYTEDRDWLRSLLPALERYYFYWTVPPHLNSSTGLSRYYARGTTPAPEVVNSERDERGRTHYERVRDYYRHYPIDAYDLSLFYHRNSDSLTELFYQGDRSMRESGFDITNRFGPFSADIVHYVPVCLNVLLYQMERDIAEIHHLMGHWDSVEVWKKYAHNRQQEIDRFLWNEETGLYFDYNFRTETRGTYEFVTTFMPLWAGLASPEQAQRLVDNLAKFETKGGLLTSTHVSGNQWDAPFGWAPLQLFAIKGLRRYGYHDEADRLTEKFISVVVTEFEKSGTLVEKYDVERCSADVSAEILFGYSSNEIGFGWTNGVVRELIHDWQQRSP